MMPTLLTILLLVAQVPLPARQTGTITGILRNAEGKPAARERVAAMARLDGAVNIAREMVLSSVAETDEQGRYRLEGIPPGEYYIVAGRVDLPTFHPGTAEMSAGTVIRIRPGETLDGIDFPLKDSSSRLSFVNFPSAQTSVKANIRVVGSKGKFPVTSASGPVKLQFTRLADGLVTEVPLNAPMVALPIAISPPAVEFRVRVSNLPGAFSVKSIARGPVDLTNDTLKLVSGATTAEILQKLNLPGSQTAFGLAIPTSSAIAFGFPGVIVGTSPGSQTSTLLFISQLALAEDLIVTIEASSPPAAQPGVRVTGMGRRSDTHPVFMSGLPGTVFSDGSFEFREVPPGRHSIVTLDDPGRAVGATIVVGESDINNIELEDIATPPANIQARQAPVPANGLAPGTKLPALAIGGRVVDGSTQQPLSGGKVFINNGRSPWFQLDEEGRFEIQHLLPGAYNLELHIFGYAVIRREVALEGENVVLDFTAQKLQ